MMRVRVRRGLVQRWFGALLCGVLAIAACGGGSGQGSGGAVKEDGTLRIAFDLDQGVATWFEPLRYEGNAMIFTNVLYDTMFYFTEDGLEPGLAESWTFPDERTVELTLRSGLKFHDGTPLNAEAVKFSWDRLMDPPETFLVTDPIRPLEAVEVVDELTVRVRLSEPVAGDWRDRLLFTSQAGYGIVSPTAFEEVGADGLNENPVGAGPYKFVEFVPGQRLVLERFEDHWDADSYEVQRLEFIDVKPGAPTVTALASGEVDLAKVDPTELRSLESQDIKVDQFERRLSTDLLWYQMCQSRPPFDKLEVRQAASYAIEREDYVDNALEGTGAVNDKFPSPGWPYYPDDVENPYPYDPEHARELVRSAGAEGAEVVILLDSDPTQGAIGQIMQEQFAEIGLDLKLEQVPNKFTALQDVEWNIYLGTGSLPTTVSSFVLPDGGGNTCNYDNPAVTNAFNKTRAVDVTDDELTSAWAEFNEAIFDDAAMFMIASPDNLVAHTEQVAGVTDDIESLDPWVMREIYVTE